GPGPLPRPRSDTGGAGTARRIVAALARLRRRRPLADIQRSEYVARPMSENKSEPAGGLSSTQRHERLASLNARDKLAALDQQAELGGGQERIDKQHEE